jgi:hypothetical protein
MRKGFGVQSAGRQSLLNGPDGQSDSNPKRLSVYTGTTASTDTPIQPFPSHSNVRKSEDTSVVQNGSQVEAATQTRLILLFLLIK